jgi:hypothetical protein
MTVLHFLWALLWWALGTVLALGIAWLIPGDNFLVGVALGGAFGLAGFFAGVVFYERRSS